MTAPPVAPAAPARRRRAVLERVLGALGSFHLAVTTLLLLALVVLVGTLEQRSMGLYDVQRTYFEAPFFVLWLFGGIPLPLPGGALLLAVLLVNLVVGGLLRLRLGRATYGVFVAHVGIVVLLGGSAIEYATAEKGHVLLREGESADRFESYTDWELAVVDVATGREHVIPGDALEAAAAAPRRFTAADLPFGVVVSGWLRNARPRRAVPPEAGVEGVVLSALRPAKTAERNTPGGVVDVVAKDGPSARGLVWGAATAPFTASVAGATFAFELRRASWPLPYTVTLSKTVGREHPGTRMPSEYSSWVRRTGTAVARDVHITMNEPMRDGGYTFYQSEFGREDGGRAFAGLAVVRNPTDRVPIVACAIIALGMLLHFGGKLARHVARQTSTRAAAGAVAPSAPAGAATSRGRAS